MLILSRRSDEAIMIGDDIEVRIFSTRGQQVRVGIIAPREISVHREEVYRRIQAEVSKKQKPLKDKALLNGVLILTRRPEEAIIIGDDIEVRILSIRGQEVRVGITAPEDISVHREEIYLKISAEKNQEPQKNLISEETD